jgi:shikimate kinase
MSNLFLIGYRCTGKTCVGRSLAEILGWPFIDADEVLVAGCGMTISAMVREKGWPFFRKKEREIIKRISSLDRHVVATGGGVVLDPGNITDMRQNGSVVWLRATSDTIRNRLLEDARSEASRPALSSKGALNEIEDVLNQRDPLYRAAMDAAVNTDDMSVEAVCERIIQELRLKPGAKILTRRAR